MDHQSFAKWFVQRGWKPAQTLSYAGNVDSADLLDLNL